MNARGRLITTLARVMRQNKPAGADAPAEAPAASEGAAAATPAAEGAAAATPAAEGAAAAPAEGAAAPAEGAAAPAEGAAAPAEGAAAPVEGAAAPAEGAAAPAEGAAAPAEGAAAPAEGAAAPAEGAPAVPAVDPKITAWKDVMFLVGSIWRSVGDDVRAAPAFASSGRKAEEARALETFHKTGDWKNEAGMLERGKRSKDAARVHEKNKNWGDATRLHEKGGDRRAALRAAIAGNDRPTIDRLMGEMSPPEAKMVLEKAGAWELLMELNVKLGDFDSVARLYEKAKQFDQAGLAWERANKLSLARKAYERARDFGAVKRVRELEVKRLVEKGDRLGAATLLLSAGDKAQAVETLKSLPGPKAFAFMQKLKLDQDAAEFAKAEVAKAIEAKQPGTRARWLELLGEQAAAAEAWLEADRKDKALLVFETLGDWTRAAQLAEGLSQLDKAQELYFRAGDKDNAERVSKLPRPAPRPVEAASAPAETPGDAEPKS